MILMVVSNPNTSSSTIPTQRAIKFAGSNTIYFQSNNQLWPINDANSYALLGFRSDGCSSNPVADWNKVEELSESRKSEYTIRTEIIGIPGLPPEQSISYRISPGNCISGPVDTTKLYALVAENGQAKFHHIYDWGTYLALGFSADSKDIIDIPIELFNRYGEGAAITSSSVTTWLNSSSIFLADYVELDYPELTPIDSDDFLVTPYNLQASPLDNDKIQLIWTLPDGTDGYSIKVFDPDGVVLKYISATDSVIINNLSSNTEYCFQVSLVKTSTGTESAKSNQVCTITNTTSIPPPPDNNWTVNRQLFTSEVEVDVPHTPGTETYAYEKTFGVYANFWVKVDSNISGITPTWKLYYTYDNTPFYDATKGGNGSGYLCTNNSYYDPNNDQYVLWHSIEVNSLALIGQYRAELWIDGVMATVCNFDVTLPKPYYPRLNGKATSCSIPFVWPFIGEGTSGSGAELFRDNEMIAFIPGSSFSYSYVDPDAYGVHYYRLREVINTPSGIFRSPFSEPFEVEVKSKLSNVTGIRSP